MNNTDFRVSTDSNENRTGTMGLGEAMAVASAHKPAVHGDHAFIQQRDVGERFSGVVFFSVGSDPHEAVKLLPRGFYVMAAGRDGGITPAIVSAAHKLGEKVLRVSYTGRVTEVSI